MHFSKLIAALLLCATTLTLSPAAAAAAARRPPQKTRASNSSSSSSSSSRAQAPAPQMEITKEKVEAIVSAIEQAGRKKDIAVLVPYLAPDFKYKLDGGGRPTRRANRAEFIELIKLGFEFTLDSTYLRKSLIVTTAPGGQSATAHTEAFEMLTLAQGTLAAHTASITTFKIYKGKILISSMEGTIEYV